MSQAQYAQTNNLSVHTLKYWLYKGKRAKASSFLQVSDLSFGTDFVIRYPHGVELKVPSTTPTAIIRALINLYGQLAMMVTGFSMKHARKRRRF